MKKFNLVLSLLLSFSAFSSDFPIDSINNPQKIIWKLGKQTSLNLRELNVIAPLMGETSDLPWSGYYWPYAFAGAAYRYMDSQVESYVDRYEVENVFPYLRDYTYRDLRRASWSEKGLAKLSPAEKYDILIGDQSFTLTKSVLKKTQSFQSAYGYIPQWFGICHGWAPASMMTKMPTKAFSMKLKDGRMLKFYPEDIMALQSLVWARTGSKLSGRRCDKTYINDNIRGGDLSCVDLNPGTFHLALLNQIGINKKALIVDKNRTSEVWNHPVFKYEVKYFHTLKKLAYSKFEDNLLDINQVRFRRSLRAVKTKQIVGVKLKYYYTDVSYQLGSSRRSSSMNKVKSVELLYDLELDSDLNIVGGEWRSTNYPDFAWVPKKSPLRVYGENLIRSVITREGAPSLDIKVLALGGKLRGKTIKGFSKLRMPIPSLVDYLLKKSREE